MMRSREKLPDPVSLRFPPELREKLDLAAAQAGRSLNSEVRLRLEWSFAPEADFAKHDAEALATIQASPAIRMEKRMVKDRADLEQRIDDLAAEVAAIKRKLGI